MKIRPIDLSTPADNAALLSLLNEYARSATGGNSPLPEPVQLSLIDSLRDCPTYTGLLAWEADRAVGLLNSFWSVSTFKAQRLLNIHDIAVTTEWQRKGVGRRLLREIEQVAMAMNCCKITLEVLEGNMPATALYRLMGFENYQLDPAMGDARLMQKWLNK